MGWDQVLQEVEGGGVGVTAMKAESPIYIVSKWFFLGTFIYCVLLGKYKSI